MPQGQGDPLVLHVSTYQRLAWCQEAHLWSDFCRLTEACWLAELSSFGQGRSTANAPAPAMFRTMYPGGRAMPSSLKIGTVGLAYNFAHSFDDVVAVGPYQSLCSRDVGRDTTRQESKRVELIRNSDRKHTRAERARAVRPTWRLQGCARFGKQFRLQRKSDEHDERGV